MSDTLRMENAVHLTLTKAATRRLLQFPAKARAAMIERLEAIAADPLALHANVKRLAGTVNGFRLRQGVWRALYSLDLEARTMTVTSIEPRGEAY
jgi:mRNA interferase RelE/StbE